MKILTVEETAAWLQERDCFAILTHRRPDGDTLGSGAALCLGLRALGKRAYLAENPEVTPKYAFLAEGLVKQQIGAEDTLICVDTASRDLLGKYSFLADKIALRIDHHGSAESFTGCELVQPDKAACGEIIYAVLMQLGVALDRAMANALYTAISTDTGCFRFANTTANTFYVAAKCMEAGAELFKINNEQFMTTSLAKLRVQSYLVENARFSQEGRVAVCALPLAAERELGASEDDMENISGFPRSIAGVKISATIRENPDGLLKLSVRAVPGYDAAAVCAKFGGGGHKGAAGATFKMTMEEAVLAVEQAMPVTE